MTQRSVQKAASDWVHGTYRGQLLDWMDLRFKFRLRPVLRSDDQKGLVLLPKRWIIERTFGRLNVCRPLGKEYEELAQTSETFIYLAMIRIMARRLDRLFKLTLRWQQLATYSWTNPRISLGLLYIVLCAWPVATFRRLFGLSID